jgi:hypothetical protein
MKGKRHSPEQIICKLREAEGMLAAKKTIRQVSTRWPQRRLQPFYPTGIRVGLPRV